VVAGVFSFCRAHHRLRVFPTRGIAGSRPIWNARPSAAGFKGQDRVYLVGVDTAKDALYARLRIDKPGPGYVHFPTIDGVDDRYFEQLTAEHVVVRRGEGRSYRQWILPQHKRNETLDCYVLAMAACRATGFRLDGEIVAQPAPPPLGDLPVSVDDEPPPEPWIDRNRLRPRSAWWDR
jgi:phage terminase large subunit GpA-like protein